MNALSYICNNLVVPLEHLRSNGTDQNENPHQDLDTVARIRPIALDVKIEASLENENEDEEDEEKVEEAELQSLGSKFTMYTWAILLFFPRYLIFKPTQFLWLLLSSPLLLVEYGVKSRLQKNNPKNPGNSKTTLVHEPVALRSINENDEDDLAGGDEIYLQRDTVKGSLSKALTPSKRHHRHSGTSTTTRTKSVTRSECSSANAVFGTKRTGRFLFPKKLIPRSILHAERRKKLVVDLDETLIHSASRSTSHSNSSQGHMVEVRFAISGVSTLYYVHKRPHCDVFLSKVSKWYDLVVFTASMKEYADPVIDWLESSFSGRFSKRLYRNNCTLRDGVGYIKDLSIFCGTSVTTPPITLGEVIIVDNSPVSYAMNVDNAIQVEGWISDPSDTDLLTLLPFLEALRYTTDVRDILALKNGEQAFLS